MKKGGQKQIMSSADYKLDRSYVLAPFEQLLAACHHNVLIGLRLVEQVDTFPAPTTEEQELFQLSFREPRDAFDEDKQLFRKWLLMNGLGDIHKAIRTGLERLIVFEEARKRIRVGETVKVHQLGDLSQEVLKMHLPQLIERVERLFNEPFEFARAVESFNSARNCLEHTNGILTSRHCNDKANDKLIIFGRRFRLYFKAKEGEFPITSQNIVLTDASIMLGTEDFSIEFAVGQGIELSLKHFLDILFTCMCIRADISLKLQ